MTPRLLVIGLDGYEASLGERWMAEGRLPALAELTERSAVVHLDHGPATRTGLAWEHVSTGRAPDRLDRWSAVDFDPDRYRARQRNTSGVPFVHGTGLRTVVLDPPYFDLGAAPEARGIVGWGAHDPGIELQSRPPELLDQARSLVGDYPARRWIYALTWPSVERTREMADALVEGTRWRTSLAQWLLGEAVPDWDLGVVVVSELHSVIESMWHGVDDAHPLHGAESAAAAEEGIRRVYEATDRLVATLCTAFPDTTVLAFSMHGMGPNESDVASMALLPELLFRDRFGRPLLDTDGDDPTAVPPLAPDVTWSAALHGRLPAVDTAGAARTGVVDRVKSRVPGRVKALARRAVGHRPDSDIPLGWMPATWYEPYWPEMDAIALPSFYDGQVRINLRGREARGRVDPADYRTACDRVESLVRACVDPRTGRSVVRAVHRPERVDPMELGPTEADFVIEWEGSPLAFDHAEHGVVGPLPFRRTGGHTGDHGIALVAGDGIAPGFHGRTSAFDVVPTVLDLLGRSPDPSLSGTSFLDEIRA